MIPLSSYTIQSLQDCSFSTVNYRRLTPAAIVVQSANGLSKCHLRPEKGEIKIAVCDTYGKNEFMNRTLQGFNRYLAL